MKGEDSTGIIGAPTVVVPTQDYHGYMIDAAPGERFPGSWNPPFASPSSHSLSCGSGSHNQALRALPNTTMDTLVISTSPSFLAEDIGPQISVTASVLIVSCTIFVGLRYYARFLTGTSFNLEDIIIPLAWLAELGLCIVGIVMVEKAGTGRHMAYVLSTDPAKIAEHFKGIIIQEILHPAAVAFSKLAVVLLYLHILTNKYERIVAKTLVFLILATWVSFTIAALFQCVPFEFNWDKSIPGGKCFDVQVYANSSSVPNIATDLAMLMLPLRTVFGLKISTGRKIGLLLIFLTGSVGIIASIIRTVVFAKTFTVGPLVDVTFLNVALIKWTILEPGMYLLSACALSFKPLFRIVARALHLQAAITHTKSSFGGNNSNVRRTTASTQTHMYPLELVKIAEAGRFHRLSGESTEDIRDDTRLQVTVTKTIELESDVKSPFGISTKSDTEAREVEPGIGKAV